MPLNNFPDSAQVYAHPPAQSRKLHGPSAGRTKKRGLQKHFGGPALYHAHQAKVLTLFPNVAVGLDTAGADGGGGFGIDACHFAIEL